MDALSEPPLPVVTLPEAPPERLGARERLMAVVEVVLCSSVPTQLALGTLAASVGLAPMTADGTLSMQFVVVVALADTAVLVSLMAGFTRARGDSIRKLWIGDRPIRAEARHGLLLTPVVFALVIAVLAALRAFAPWMHNVALNPFEALASRDLWSGLLLALVAIVAGGVREELQRAFLLDRFERCLGGAAVGVVVLSVAFGLGHYVQGWDAAVATGTMGLLWAIVYLRRRSSVAPVVSHSAFNSLEILRVVAGS